LVEKEINDLLLRRDAVGMGVEGKVTIAAMIVRQSRRSALACDQCADGSLKRCLMHAYAGVRATTACSSRWTH
jgi:hypothetical protein